MSCWPPRQFYCQLQKTSRHIVPQRVKPGLQRIDWTDTRGWPMAQGKFQPGFHNQPRNLLIAHNQYLLWSHVHWRCINMFTLQILWNYNHRKCHTIVITNVWGIWWSNVCNLFLFISMFTPCLSIYETCSYSRTDTYYKIGKYWIK